MLELNRTITVVEYSKIYTTEVLINSRVNSDWYCCADSTALYWCSALQCIMGFYSLYVIHLKQTANLHTLVAAERSSVPVSLVTEWKSHILEVLWVYIGSIHCVCWLNVCDSLKQLFWMYSANWLLRYAVSNVEMVHTSNKADVNKQNVC
jgi:hypothetical protein